MLDKTSDCLIPLIQYLREHSPDDLVSISIFINYNSVEITTVHKTLDDLKFDNISMRNVKGEWIKEDEIKLGPHGNVLNFDHPDE